MTDNDDDEEKEHEDEDDVVDDDNDGNTHDDHNDGPQCAFQNPKNEHQVVMVLAGLAQLCLLLSGLKFKRRVPGKGSCKLLLNK